MAATPETYCPDPASRLPHRLAVLLVCATFPLIWVGGLVTTYEAGMAVPDWPTTYGYNLFLYPWQTWLTGPWDLFIEHGHRLLGALVGGLAILLCVALFLRERRTWLKVLGVVALAAVIVQGVLGGLRVTERSEQLAMVHGCFAAVFFSLTVALAVVTSRLWRRSEPASVHPAAGKLRTLAVVTTGLIYAQYLLGAQLRHIPADASLGAFRAFVAFHLFMAFLLVIHITLLSARVMRHHRQESALVRPALGLAALAALQIVLGAGAWVVNYGVPGGLGGTYAWSAGHVVVEQGAVQATITTGHVAAGSLMLVTALVVALRSFRLVRPKTYTANAAGSLPMGAPA